MSKLSGKLLAIVGMIVLISSVFVRTLIIFAFIGGIMFLFGLIRIAAEKKAPAENRQQFPQVHNHQAHPGQYQHPAQHMHQQHQVHQQQQTITAYHNQTSKYQAADYEEPRRRHFMRCPGCGAHLRSDSMACPHCSRRFR